jgi:hypothetical protein
MKRVILKQRLTSPQIVVDKASLDKVIRNFAHRWVSALCETGISGEIKKASLKKGSLQSFQQSRLEAVITIQQLLFQIVHFRQQNDVGGEQFFDLFISVNDRGVIFAAKSRANFA